MVRDEKSIIILVSGKAESGKDTACTYIYNELGLLRPRRLAFAKPVKSFAALLGWDGKKDEKGRAMLQWLGDGIRQFNPELWCQTAYKSVCRLRGLHYRTFIFSDCRYLNDISFFKDRFTHVYVVRVIRPQHENALTDAQKAHASETELDDYDFDAVISNGSNLCKLEDSCASAVNRLRTLGSF